MPPFASMTIVPSLKVAVLMNGASSLREDVSACFNNAIHAVAPTAAVDFYDPIVAQEYPQPSDYDLIVLSGGGTDPMCQEPWVLKMQGFVRSTATDFPATKLLGICWGHQTISVALGGKVAPMEKAELGVHTIELTERGSEFFSPVLPLATTCEILEYHKREITEPGKGLIALATNNQCFVNASNTILTFQGHPEMTEAFGKKVLPSSTKSYMGVKEEEVEEIRKGFEKHHDGITIWKRIVAWVKE